MPVPAKRALAIGGVMLLLAGLVAVMWLARIGWADLFAALKP